MCDFSVFMCKAIPKLHTILKFEYSRLKDKLVRLIYKLNIKKIIKLFIVKNKINKH